MASPAPTLFAFRFVSFLTCVLPQKMGEARELTLKRLERLASQELFTLREVLK
jgi:hypothetical protein